MPMMMTVTVMLMTVVSIVHVSLVVPSTCELKVVGVRVQLLTVESFMGHLQYQFYINELHQIHGRHPFWSICTPSFRRHIHTSVHICTPSSPDANALPLHGASDLLGP
eukprot:7202436-Karenia_brevis.AAC.2